MKQYTCTSVVTLEGAGIGFDVVVHITYDYAPAERMTNFYPGCDEQYEITDVKLEFNDAMVTLERNQYDDEQIIQIVEMAAAEAAADEYNYEDAA